MNQFELPEERLATTDEYGGRVFLYPADVRGKFRAWRSRVHFVLILVFLALPWLKINGHQALLLDLPRRRFAIFGLTFWAHDAPMLIFVFGGLAFGLFFVTAVWGRVWCGWACPQTVFIDAIYRKIERWVEGSHLKRKQMDAGPLTFEKLGKKSIKWALFVSVTLIITHSFLAYFVGADRLISMVQRPPRENWTSFLLVLVSTGVLLFDFAWFREQFCTIMCPYGRLQSVLMDDDSMVVTYDTSRGEPRRGKVAPGEDTGDCVNCYRCVQVCPTGVDIRRGVQMECIACTACIDACDEVMEKVKKPKGLIRYDTAKGLRGQKPQNLRPRTIFYLAFVVAAVVGLTYSVATHKPVDVVVLRGKSDPFQIQTLSDGKEVVVNLFQIDLSNQSQDTHNIHFQISEDMQEQGVSLVTPLNPLPIAAGKTTRAQLFVRFPRILLEHGSAKMQIEIETENVRTKELMKKTEEVKVVGPFS